jgi:hypothetical protein
MQRVQHVPSPLPIDWSAQTVDVNGASHDVITYLFEAIEKGKKSQLIPVSDQARKYWNRLYLQLEQEQTGFLAGIVSRGAVHVRRLAMILCLMDGETVVEKKHLKAAEAIWNHSINSAQYIFIGYTDDQAKILAWAKDKTEGFTASELHGLFHRHKTGDWLRAQVDGLVVGGRLTKQEINGKAVYKLK